MKKIFSMLFCVAALAASGTAAGSSAETLTVIRNGNTIQLLTDFPGGYTMNRSGNWDKGPNKQFNFTSTVLLKKGMTPIRVKSSGDDTTPWNLNGTYIGANHGDSIASAVIFTKPHGLTEKDCGSEWRDSTGRKFYVLKIENPNIFWVLSENLSKDKDIWYFIRPKAGETLTGADGRVLKDFKVQYRQLYSPVRILSRKFLADGKELQDKAKVKCQKFTIEEEYDIVATDAILKHVIANKGRQAAFNAPGVERFLSQKIVYTFFPDSSCIVTHNTRFYRNVRLGYMGFVQAYQMNKGKYAKHLYYIPKTRPFKFDNQEWDFAGGVDFTRPINGFMKFRSDTFENPASMPERFVQYLKGGKNMPDIGFAFGYSLLEGCTTPEKRAKGTTVALFLYKTHKSYPHAVNSGRRRIIKAVDTFYCMAYRQ